MQRKLNFPATVNARDLGGYPTADGKVTHWESLVRADSTSRLTPQGAQAVMDYGVRTIIDLRFIEEKEHHPSVFENANHGTRYFFHSLLGESWERFIERGGVFNDSYWYGSFLDLSQSQIGHVLGLIADAPPGGVLYHCAVGKDRTGVLSMLLLTNAGVPQEIVAQDYALSATYLHEECVHSVSQTDDPVQKERIVEGYSCRPEYALGTLNHLNQRYGGIEGYLHAISLSDAQIARLRARLV
jgi:protein-tyrosine phosphatase